MNRRFYVGISINPTDEKRRLVVIGATPTRKKCYAPVKNGTLSVWLLMGVVEWFSGTHFSWSITPSVVKVHMNQDGFAANLAERFQVDNNPNISKLITIPPLLCTGLAFLLMRPQTPPMTRTQLPNNDKDVRRHL